MKRFIKTTSIQEAAKQCPWAKAIIREGDGFWCFKCLKAAEKYVNNAPVCWG